MSHHCRVPRVLLVSLALAVAACGDDAGQAEAGETTPPPPAMTAAPGTTTTATTATDTSGSTGPAPAGCDCASGEYCAAPHQRGVIDPGDDALVYGCQAECVPAEEPSVWCREDAPSCCAGLSCDEFGFCVDPNAVSTGSGSGTAGGSGSTTGGSTGDTGSASGSGTGMVDTGGESSGSTTGG